MEVCARDPDCRIRFTYNPIKESQHYMLLRKMDPNRERLETEDPQGKLTYELVKVGHGDTGPKFTLTKRRLTINFIDVHYHHHVETLNLGLRRLLAQCSAPIHLCRSK